MLSRLQAIAVQGGDPVRIAAASQELNAEVLLLLGSIAASERRFPEAIALYRESLALHPDLETQLGFAKLLAQAGEGAEAVNLAQAAAAAEPKNARVFALLGNILRASGRDKEAVDALSHALELDPNPSVAFALGSTLLATRDKTRADQIFARILAGSDGAAIWHVAIGDAYRESDYLSEAAAEFRKAIAEDPRATHAEFFLGLVNLQMNEWGPNSESFLHLRKSLEQNPREYLSNFYLGALESTDGSDIASSNRHLHAAALANPTQPEVWIYLGQNANRENRTDEAIADLRKAIELTGSDESRNQYQVRRAYFTLGRLLLARGQREEGQKLLAAYKRTSSLDAAAAGKDVADREGSGAAALKPSGSLSELSGSPATQEAAKAVSQQPEAAQISPELKSAEAQLRTLLSSGFNDLGTAEARQQQYADALRDFKEAERWGTPSPQLLRNIASAAYRLNTSTEVERALTQYFLSTPLPNDPRARLMLATAQFDLGRFPEAAHNFQAAGDLALADSKTTYSYAFSLVRDGHAQEANALADRLMAMQLPSSLLALVCHIYFDAENYASSNTCYRRVAADDPTLRTAHYFVGESLIHLDRSSDAIPELRQEMELTPEEPNVQSALAFALSQTSHRDEAKTLLQRAVATHPEHADAQYQLGKLLLEDGDVAASITHLEASETSDNSKDYTHYQLAAAYRKAGRAADAERELQAYRKAKELHRNDRALPVTAQP